MTNFLIIAGSILCGLFSIYILVRIISAAIYRSKYQTIADLINPKPKELYNGEEEK